LQPPDRWMPCELESKELLAICLKKLRGLSKVRLIDAGFVWTEPHSKRIKVKVTIQNEVFAGAILQQTFVVEFVVSNLVCGQCQRALTGHETWKACVQARQKVPHKRTFFFLEQLILKHKMNEDTLKVGDQPDGLDFYYNHRSQAMKMIDFLQSTAPIKSQSSKELVTQDSVNMTYDYKYSFSVEIAPICKDDAVCIPPKVISFFGGANPLLVCTKVSATLHFIDPLTCKTYDLNSTQYWRYGFQPLLAAAQLVEYTVIDVELVGKENGRWALADVDVQKTAELGVGDVMTIRSHLGRVLQPGDSALGYDFATTAFNPNDLDGLQGKELPYAILIRKHYPDRKKKSRAWKLKQLDMETEEPHGGKVSKKEAAEEEKRANDYERFLQELEEDKEMRQQIDLYRDPNVAVPAQQEMEMEDEDAPPEVPLEELLDSLTMDDGEEV